MIRTWGAAVAVAAVLCAGAGTLAGCTNNNRTHGNGGTTGTDLRDNTAPTPQTTSTSSTTP
jgi:hypothetical protein